MDSSAVRPRPKFQSESSKNIKTMYHLMEVAERFVQDNSKGLRGEFNFFTVYRNSDDGKVETYILIHADYYEKDVSKDTVQTVILEDIAQLNKKLKKKELPIDYCFVMPYYYDNSGQGVLYNGLISESIKQAGY